MRNAEQRALRAEARLKIAKKALRRIGVNYEKQSVVHPWKHAMNSGTIARRALTAIREPRGERWS